MRRWAKLFAEFALVMVIGGTIIPDACADALLGPQTFSISSSSQDRQPFGCKCDEECFCCAHFAPVQTHVDSVVLAFIDVEPPITPQTVLKGTLAAPYHPPRA